MKDHKVGIFLYNRLFDPVIQSNFWLYILDILNNEPDQRIVFYLVTYENAIPLTDEQNRLVEEWKSKGLVWIRLKWSPGTRISSKTKDIINGFFTILYLRYKGCRHFISLASVAAAYLYLYHTVLRFKYYLYQFEPHSEYAIDNKMWPRDSFQYKVSHYLERKAAEKAKVISSGTKFMEERLRNDWKVKATFYKIPSVANDKKFQFSEKNRAVMREQLKFINGTDVLFYPGKFGDLYYREETAFMFKWLKEEIDNLHFLIVTPHKDQEIIDLMDNAQVNASDYTIAHSDYDNIHHYYSAADFAVIAVPSGPSKKFISNIKVGEYLTAGLPFLITEGVSEDYIYAKEKRVGVVVEEFSEQHIKSVVPEIRGFLSRDKAELRSHCRKVGLDYRGFEKLNIKFKEALADLLGR